MEGGRGVQVAGAEGGDAVELGVEGRELGVGFYRSGGGEERGLELLFDEGFEPVVVFVSVLVDLGGAPDELQQEVFQEVSLSFSRSVCRRRSLSVELSVKLSVLLHHNLHLIILIIMQIIIIEMLIIPKPLIPLQIIQSVHVLDAAGVGGRYVEKEVVGIIKTGAYLERVYGEKERGQEEEELEEVNDHRTKDW